MEKIRIFRIKPLIAWLTIVIAVLSAAFGIINLSLPLKEALNLKEGSSGILFIIQGAIFIIWGIVYLKRRKFFISWDERELQLFMPGAKKPETININEIRLVNMKLFEIEFKVSDTVRKIDLNSMIDEDMKRVKEKFESISAGIPKA